MADSKPQTYEIGIRCDYFVGVAGGNASQVDRDVFLGINGAKIAQVAPWGKGDWKCTRFIDAKNKVVLPGLINGHTHLPMSLFRGLADDLPFAEWLHNYILPSEAKVVSQEFVKVGTQLSALESIRTGVTTLNDMYFFSDQVADVLDRAGLRGIIAECVSDFPSPDDKANDGTKFKIQDRLYERVKGHARLSAALGPHAPYTCSEDLLKKMHQKAVKNGSLFHIHVSESRGEIEESLKKFNQTPVERLQSLGCLDERTVFAHGVHLKPSEIEILARTKTSVIYNPESNMKLSSGVAPIPAYLAAGVKVGIGTDGAASNNNQILFTEMDTGAKLQKLSGNNTAMTAPQALSLATWGGAGALGLQDQIGSLEEGKLADLAILDLKHPHLQPVHDVVSQLVYSATGLEVDTVICHGKILMDRGEILGWDLDQVYHEANLWRDRVAALLPKG